MSNHADSSGVFHPEQGGLQQKIIHLSSELDKYKTLFEKCDFDYVNDLETEIEHLKKQNLDLQYQVEEVTEREKRKVEEIKKNFEDSFIYEDRYQNIIQSQKDENEHLTNTLEEYQSDIEQYKNQNQELNDKLKETQKSIEQKGEQIANLEKALESEKESKLKLLDQLSVMESKLKLIKEQNDEMSKETKALSDQNAQLEKGKTILQQEIEQLKFINQDLIQQIEHFKDDIEHIDVKEESSAPETQDTNLENTDESELKEENQRLLEKINLFSEDVQKNEETIQSLEDDITSCIKEIHELKEIIQQTSNE